MTRVLILLLVLGLLTACAPEPAGALAPAQQTEPYPDWRFGIVETTENPEAAATAGAAWTRLRLHWGEVQADGPDSWSPAFSDEQLEAELAAGRLVVGLLIGIPDWARGVDRLPGGLNRPLHDPENLWATFVRDAARRYAGRIDHWIIWNEPDIWDESAPGHTWDGTVEEFARLQQVAYLAAKEANSDAVIHLPAFTYFWDANYGREQYFGKLLDALGADPAAVANNYYFDVATAHLYFQPNLIYEIIQEFKAILSAHGLAHPLWLVETNAPPADDPAWPVDSVTLNVTLQEQAAFMPQALAAALAAGAERIAVYKLQDTPGDVAANPEPFGLLRRDGSARPAFETLQTAARYLAGAASATRERWDAVGQIRLDQQELQTTVLFARLPAPQQATVAAIAEEGMLVDMWGHQQTITARDGAFTVDLPPAACAQSIGDYCMIGGATYYLVQAAGGAPLPPLPAPHHSPTAVPDAVSATAAPPGAVAVTANTAEVDFPNTVTFRLATDQNVDLTTAELTYDVVARSCVEVSSEVPVELVDGAASWTWVMSRSGNPPPGAEIWWQWTLTDSTGARTTTPRQSLTLEDQRFAWRTVSSGPITLYWYEGDEVGPLLLDAATEGLSRLESDMGFTLQEDAKIFIYEDAAAMRAAVLYIQDWAGGVAFSEYNTILIGVPPSVAAGWGRDTVRHELAHLALGQLGWSCLGGSRPTWLEEGLATYAEGEPDAETVEGLATAIATDRLAPLRSLNGAFPAHSEEANLAYVQSYSVVDFLLAEHGRDKLQALIAVLAEAADYDAALEQVYGFNVDGLEVAWRESVGAPPRTVPPTPTALVAGSVPTVPPLVAPSDRATPPAAAATPVSAPQARPCALGLLPLLLLAVVVPRAARIRAQRAGP